MIVILLTALLGASFCTYFSRQAQKIGSLLEGFMLVLWTSSWRIMWYQKRCNWTSARFFSGSLLYFFTTSSSHLHQLYCI